MYRAPAASKSCNFDSAIYMTAPNGGDEGRGSFGRLLPGAMREPSRELCCPFKFRVL